MLDGLYAYVYYYYCWRLTNTSIGSAKRPVILYSLEIIAEGD